MVILSPVIRLDVKETFGVLRAVPVELLVVRLQDLISKKTFNFNKTYKDVISAGGLHNYLDFHGHIILSLVMRDEIISNLGPEKYAIAINSLFPDSFTTIDGETYEGEYWLSLKEIERIHTENRDLVKLCPKCQPLGLVKGCTITQIEHHIELLKSLGIEDFVFHVGDYLRHGNPDMILKARRFSHRIRKHARRLILYGMGSQERLIEFSFADIYVTFNHFVTAKNGMKFVGTKKVKYIGSFNPQIVVNNFVQMYKNVESLKEQLRLS